MSITTKQSNFIENLKLLAKDQATIRSTAFNINEDFGENFDVGGAFDISNVGDALLEQYYGVTVTFVKQFVARNCVSYLDFWDNGSVTTREFGRFARRVGNKIDKKRIHISIRQSNFLADVVNLAYDMIEMYKKTYLIEKDYKENFASSMEYDLASLTTAELENAGVTIADISNFIDGCSQYINYWTNNTVTSGTYGTYAIAVMNNTKYM